MQVRVRVRVEANGAGDAKKVKKIRFYNDFVGSGACRRRPMKCGEGEVGTDMIVATVLAGAINASSWVRRLVCDAADF